MKAVVYDKSAGPDAVALREVEAPVPRDGEVLIQVEASSLNAADYRSLRMGLIPKRRIFGADIAGRVAAAGKGVETWKQGDEVMGDLSGCGFGFLPCGTAPLMRIVMGIIWHAGPACQSAKIG